MYNWLTIIFSGCSKLLIWCLCIPLDVLPIPTKPKCWTQFIWLLSDLFENIPVIALIWLLLHYAKSLLNTLPLPKLSGRSTRILNWVLVQMTVHFSVSGSDLLDPSVRSKWILLESVLLTLEHGPFDIFSISYVSANLYYQLDVQLLP